MPWWHGAWPPHHALVFLGVSDLVCPAWSCLAPSFVLVLCLTLAAVVAQFLDCAVSAGSWSPTGYQLAWMTVIVACWPAFSIWLWCLLGSVIFSSGWAVYLLPGWPWFWAFGLRCSLTQFLGGSVSMVSFTPDSSQLSWMLAAVAWFWLHHPALLGIGHCLLFDTPSLSNGLLTQH